MAASSSGRRLAAAAVYAAAVAAVVALAAGGMSLPNVSSLLKMPRFFALEGFGSSGGRDGKKRRTDDECVGKRDEKHGVVKKDEPGAIVPVACDADFDDSKLRAPAASRDPPPDAAEHDDVSVTFSELVADRNRAELFNACRLRRQTTLA
jgi:hypothetical protein